MQHDNYYGTAGMYSDSMTAVEGTVANGWTGAGYPQGTATAGLFPINAPVGSTGAQTFCLFYSGKGDARISVSGQVDWDSGGANSLSDAAGELGVPVQLVVTQTLERTARISTTADWRSTSNQAVPPGFPTCSLSTRIGRAEACGAVTTDRPWLPGGVELPD